MRTYFYFLVGCICTHTCENVFVLLLVAMHLHTYFWEQSCTHMSGKRFVLFLVGMHLYLWEWCCNHTHDHKFSELNIHAAGKFFFLRMAKKGESVLVLITTDTVQVLILMILHSHYKSVQNRLILPCNQKMKDSENYTVHGKWNVLLLLKTSIPKCDRPNETLP